MGNKLYLVLPAYNEEENIEAVVKSWRFRWKNGGF